jgi:hypothetical protein
VSDRGDWNGELDDVEAIVRSAGRYVRASDDLRPRVLESARLHCGERRARRRIGEYALVVVLLAALTITTRQSLDLEHVQPSRLLVAAGFDELFSPAAVVATRSGDGDWRMIEAFTELRRQQARVLRLAL